MKEVSVSQVWFRENDKVDFHGNSGCGLFVYKGLWGPSDDSEIRNRYREEEDEDFSDSDDDEDGDEKKKTPPQKVKIDMWDTHRSFYFSFDGSIAFDF